MRRNEQTGQAGHCGKKPFDGRHFLVIQVGQWTLAKPAAVERAQLLRHHVTGLEQPPAGRNFHPQSGHLFKELVGERQT